MGEELLLVGLGEGDAEALLLGLADPLPRGEAEALSVALGVAVALLLALGVLLGLELLVALVVAVAFADAVALAVGFALAVALADAVALAVAEALEVAEAVALAEGEGDLLDLASWVLALGVLPEESEAASRTTAVWPAGTERAAEVVAGGWPHTLRAAALTVAAPAAVLPPRRPPMMPEETMAAPATMPRAEDPDRADLMAAPSSP